MRKDVRLGYKEKKMTLVLRGVQKAERLVLELCGFVLRMGS